MKLFKTILASGIMAFSVLCAEAQDPNFYIYLCIGQSNMEGNARVEKQDTKDVPERLMLMVTQDFQKPERKTGDWSVAVPPLVGQNYGLSPADYFGRTMLANLPADAKVGIVPVAIGGCKIEHLDKDYDPASVEKEAGWFKEKMVHYDNAPYQRLIDCAKKAQKDGVIKGILLHQGESNNGDPQWPEKVKKIYDDILSDLGLAANSIPLIAGEMVQTDMGGICGGMNQIVNSLPQTLQVAKVASSKDLPQRGDGLHFTAFAYRELGSRYAEKMLEAMGIDNPKLPYSKLQNVYATSSQVSSPDGKIVVTVTDEGTHPGYSVTYDGKPFILPSPLGLQTNVGYFDRNMSLTGSSDVNEIANSYTLPNIKKIKVDYLAHEKTFIFSNLGTGKPAMEVQMRVSDNDIAFRYKILPSGETLCCVVTDEATGFNMPDGTTTFLCPQMWSMSGFARTAPSYETNYSLDDQMGKNGYGVGYTFPCLFKNGENGWMLISETGIAGDYCGSHLVNKKDGEYTISYAMRDEQNGFGSTGASVALPGYTPWRTITIGETLNPIVETTIPFDLVDTLYKPSKDYKPGKGSWSWIIGQDASCNYDEQKRYIDFAADMGWDSILIDAWWDRNIGYDKIEELAKYAKDKGVGIFLWYNSNGSWNDAPQTPRGVMNDIVKRRKDMKWMQEAGIRGIKVDFFGGDKQETMRLYHDILADANDYGIQVIFHGCTLPRGWERMYPNYVASEAVLASENLNFSQAMCDAEARNASIHPFIRNTVGAMDFGGSTLNKYYRADNQHGSQRKTSDVFALATAVLFQSPVQHFAMAPNNLEDAPDWAVDFMKKVPTTWDDIKFIDGYPGKYVVIARRSGDKWYIAGINAEEAPRNLEIELPKGIEATLYSDDLQLNGSKNIVKPNKKGKVNISIPNNGGVVLVY